MRSSSLIVTTNQILQVVMAQNLIPIHWIAKNAQSVANINICNEINEKLFSVADLADSTITINHTVSVTDDPMIEIDIEFPFEPITPGLGLIGDLTIHVNSQMIFAPIARQ